MKGLLLKDYYEIRNQFGLIIPLIAVYAIVTSFIGDDFMFSGSYILVGMITMLLAMLPTSSFAFDEWSGWDMYGLTMKKPAADDIKLPAFDFGVKKDRGSIAASSVRGVFSL